MSMYTNGPLQGLGDIGYINISLLYLETNPDSWVVQPPTYSGYWWRCHNICCVSTQLISLKRRAHAAISPTHVPSGLPSRRRFATKQTSVLHLRCVFLEEFRQMNTQLVHSRIMCTKHTNLKKPYYKRSRWKFKIWISPNLLLFRRTLSAHFSCNKINYMH